ALPLQHVFPVLGVFSRDRGRLPHAFGVHRHRVAHSRRRLHMAVAPKARARATVGTTCARSRSGTNSSDVATLGNHTLSSPSGQGSSPPLSPADSPPLGLRTRRRSSRSGSIRAQPGPHGSASSPEAHTPPSLPGQREDTAPYRDRRPCPSERPAPDPGRAGSPQHRFPPPRAVRFPPIGERRLPGRPRTPSRSPRTTPTP